MNDPKCSANTLTGYTCYYKMANEHVNSGTAKELLHSYKQKKRKTKNNSVGSGYITILTA